MRWWRSDHALGGIVSPPARFKKILSPVSLRETGIGGAFDSFVSFLSSIFAFPHWTVESCIAGGVFYYCCCCSFNSSFCLACGV
ncbi:hypothetical protein BDV26DRAFT_274896, partial [Aspergillus bertholletiae]